MATNNKYKKTLQDEFPKSPECWFPETDEERLELQRENLKQRKFNRGHRRWKKLPEPIDVSFIKLLVFKKKKKKKKNINQKKKKKKISI